jgi:hypothetical protein
MLGDSLAHEGRGYHVEQLEIRFAPELTGERIASAWAATVARTEVLRVAFAMENGEPVGMEPSEPEAPRLLTDEPASWGEWLAEDRRQLSLATGRPPWRAAYWPAARRFVWTFHHALLDGRSIARILRSFLTVVKSGEEPERLALPVWSPPDAATVARAAEIFRAEFAGLTPPESPYPEQAEAPSRVIRRLGGEAARRLLARAEELGVSAPAMLTWAWGQAVAQVSGTEAAEVEQVRSGPPQAGTAGFSMLLLPLVIRRADGGPVADHLRDFHDRLRALRAIEAVSPDDLPAGAFPDLSGPWSSVVMTERGTLRHMAGDAAREPWIESITLHEGCGDCLMAAGYVLPDLRLEVEGGCRSALLDRWATVVAELVK